MTPPVRRFEPGASGMWYAHILTKAGYRVRFKKANMYAVVEPGKSKEKNITQKKLDALIDKLRAEQGLEPIRKVG